jgi:hypothetical protein
MQITMTAQNIPGVSPYAASNNPRSNTTPGTSTNQDTAGSATNASGSQKADPSTSSASQAGNPSGSVPEAVGDSASSSSNSGSSVAAKVLEQLIKNLEAQLAAIESEISALSRQKQPNGSPNLEVSTLEAAANTIQGAISTATSELVAALKQQGQTSGSLVNQQA